MATVVEYTVGAGKNYADYVAWNADMNAIYGGDLTAGGGFIVKGKGTGLVDMSTGVNVSGCVSSADCYKWLCADRLVSVWDLNPVGTPLRGELPGAGIHHTVNTNSRWLLNEDHILFEKLTWMGNRTGLTSPSGVMSIAGDDVTVRDVYMRQANSSALSNTGGQLVIAGLRAKVINTHISFEGSNATLLAVEFGGDATNDDDAPTLIACSFVRPSDRTINTSTRALKRNGISGGGRKMRMIACTFYGFGELWYTGGTGAATFTSDSNYNATNLAAGSTPYVDLLPGADCKYGGDIIGPGDWTTAGKVYVNTTLAAGDWAPVSGGVFDNVVGAAVITGFPNPNPTSNPVNGPELREGTGGRDARGNVRSASAPTLGALEASSDNEITGTSTGFAFATGSNSGGSLRVRVGPFYDENDDLIVSKTGIKWWFIDAEVPGDRDAPIGDGGVNGVIGADSYLDIAITRTTLEQGDWGYLVASDPSGSGDTQWDGYNGPAQLI